SRATAACSPRWPERRSTPTRGSAACLLLRCGSRRGGDLDLVAVFHRAHRGKRTRDDLVAVFEAVEHFEELVAGDADLERLEHRAAVLHDEDAFELFLRLARLEIRGRSHAAGARLLLRIDRLA